MSNYQQVQEALSAGAAPASICATCPWDRFCIVPPDMTKAEIDQKMEESQRATESSLKNILGNTEASPEHAESKALGGMITAIMNAALYAGKEMQSTVCPVLVVRMRGSEGRKIVDNVRAQMMSWDDNAVSV